MTDFRRGQTVKVYMGGIWQSGEYIRADRDSWFVRLPKRMVRVYDERNIKSADAGRNRVAKSNPSGGQ